jgi:hypothetical protein
MQSPWNVVYIRFVKHNRASLALHHGLPLILRTPPLFWWLGKSQSDQMYNHWSVLSLIQQPPNRVYTLMSTYSGSSCGYPKGYPKRWKLLYNSARRFLHLTNAMGVTVNYSPHFSDAVEIQVPKLGYSEVLRRLTRGPSPAAAACVEETGMTKMVCVLLVGTAALAALTVTAVGMAPWPKLWDGVAAADVPTHSQNHKV